LKVRSDGFRKLLSDSLKYLTCVLVCAPIVKTNSIIAALVNRLFKMCFFILDVFI
jgi:hypothetical protein